MDFLDYLTIFLIIISVCILLFAIIFVCVLGIKTFICKTVVDDSSTMISLDVTQTDTSQRKSNTNVSWEEIELIGATSDMSPEHKRMLDMSTQYNSSTDIQPTE